MFVLYSSFPASLNGLNKVDPIYSISLETTFDGCTLQFNLSTYVCHHRNAFNIVCPDNCYIIRTLCGYSNNCVYTNLFEMERFVRIISFCYVSEEIWMLFLRNSLVFYMLVDSYSIPLLMYSENVEYVWTKQDERKKEEMRVCSTFGSRW